MKMKTYGLTLMVIIFSLAMSGNLRALTTHNVSPGDDIQAVIDAASSGDIIEFAPGTYIPQSTISIHKSLILLGPQAGIDPRPSAGTIRCPGDEFEAIIDGGGISRIFSITADDVVIDGLEVMTGSGDMISSPGEFEISGVILRYNIIHNATGDEGVQMRYCTDCFIEFNHVFDIAQDGINLCCGSTGGSISYNEVHHINSENAAIYCYGSTNTTIQCNLVYEVFRNDGIKLGDKNGGDAANSGGNILDNVVHDTAQDGITVYMSDVLVDGNEVYNSRSENGAIYVAHAVSDITISNNIVRDNTLQTLKWTNPGGIMIGTGGNATNIHVNNNNIFNNLPNGVTNMASDELDAESNWWGDSSGPGVVGSGFGDSVSFNVDFDPWLNEALVIVNPCGPQVIEVDIDIKPGSDPNSINLSSAGVIPVAILSSATFDATTVDPATVSLAGAEIKVAGKSGKYLSHEEDVNDDGLLDLVCQVLITEDWAIEPGETIAELIAETYDGQSIRGEDAISIVPDN